MGARAEPKTGSSSQGNPKSRAGKASHLHSPELLRSNLEPARPRGRGQAPARVCQVASRNMPFPLPTSGLSLPAAVSTQASKQAQGCWGAVPGDTGGILRAAGQGSREAAAASGVGGLGSALCSRPQLAGGHRKKTEPSFIYFSCKLCFRCSPEGPFEATQAAPDPSPQLINTCRQPGLPGAAGPGQP